MRCKTHTGRDEREERRSRRLPVSGALSGVGTFSGSRSGPPLSGTAIDISIRTSLGSGDFFRALDQDLSWESGLLLGSRSGPPLSGLLSMSSSGPLSRVGTSFRLLIRTSSLGTCFGDLNQDLSRNFFRGSRSGLLSGLLSRSRLGPLSGSQWGAWVKQIGTSPMFSFPQSCHFLANKNWEFFGIVFFLV